MTLKLAVSVKFFRGGELFRTGLPQVSYSFIFEVKIVRGNQSSDNCPGQKAWVGGQVKAAWVVPYAQTSSFTTTRYTLSFGHLVLDRPGNEASTPTTGIRILRLESSHPSSAVLLITKYGPLSLLNFHVHETTLISCAHAQWHCIEVCRVSSLQGTSRCELLGTKIQQQPWFKLLGQSGSASSWQLAIPTEYGQLMLISQVC